MKLFGKELKLTGKLTLLAGTSNESPLNIPHGTAPTSPANGDDGLLPVHCTLELTVQIGQSSIMVMQHP